MDSLFKTIGSGDHGHPSEEELLLYVDGELAAKAAITVPAHLEACWTCRVRTEKIEETISTFVDYRNQVLKPLSSPPPSDWNGFGGRLKGLVSEVGRPTVFANLRGALGRVFSTPGLSLNLRVLMRPVAVALILTILTVVFLRFNRSSIVSASEMLQRSAAARQSEITRTNQAVVYQKLQVRRKLVSSSASEGLTWEVWNDIVNLRTRQSVEDPAGRRFLDVESNGGQKETTSKGNASPRPGSSTLTELSALLRSNHMNPTMPLAASSYEVWSQSITSKHEEVSRTTSSDGRETLTLRTLVIGQLEPGAIAEASLVVRANDWHPVEERLRVKSEQGDEEFELIEAAYSVVSLNTLSPEVFNQPVVASSPANGPIAAMKEAEPPLNSVVQPVTPVVASSELEVEVLQLLNQAGADLGEQVSATKDANGLLHVAGVVDSSRRKEEILRALEPVAKNPAVRIEIVTVAEAVAAEQRQRNLAKATPAPVTEQEVEINNEAIAAAPELRRHFSSDEEVHQFAMRMVRQSRSAMRHVFAMKRLMGQFTPEEVRALTPEAKSKWVGLIRSHARAYQAEAEGLRRALLPIFFPAAPSEPVDRGVEITDASLTRAVDQLLTIASANDAVIRAAFATTSGGVSTSAVGSTQFLRSLRSAEAMAAQIASGP